MAFSFVYRPSPLPMQSKMKSFHYIILALCMAFVSCGDDADNNLTVSGTSDNLNINTAEKGTQALGIEMPKVQKGNNYLLITKYDDASIGINYTIEWDCLKRAQRWTCWTWTPANNFKGWDRNKWRSGATYNGFGGNGDPFQPDPAIPAQYRSELSDYSGSGYNRGHICASEDRICSQEVNGQTFYLSNMHPQVYGFNGAVWANMESKVRTWRDATTKNGGTFYVCKGGTIYDVNLDGKLQPGVVATIGANKIPVPKYFFMAVLKKTAAGTYSGMAFWAEHKSDASTNLTPYMISIDELERRTGYDFFCNLSDKLENTVESILVTSDWK